MSIFKEEKNAFQKFISFCDRILTWVILAVVICISIGVVLSIPVACSKPECTSNEMRCIKNKVELCGVDGQWHVVKDCSGFAEMKNGKLEPKIMTCCSDKFGSFCSEKEDCNGR